ncbi:MAG: tetratricopeptide repeat protein, partial [Myxococcales bacterium]
MARRLGPALLLVVLTLAVFGQAIGFGFVDFDDGSYVTGVEPVQRGLSWEGVAWALTSRHGVAWQPLTWLSHMLDFTCFGAHPAGHHATSVLLHALNGLLLFGLLHRATGSEGRSLLVAALFAVHPLRVEPVVWVAERKELLATCLGLLALLAYVAWTRHGGRARYLGCAAALAAGLLAKSTLVTLPILMLLLDHWPLRRLEDWTSLRRRLVEKAPLFALCAAAALATLAAQAPAMHAGAELSLATRLANAVLAGTSYLGKTLWPVGLSVYYPHPWIPGTGGTPPAPWIVATCAALLATLTAAALRGPRPVRVGWLWFAIALAPMLGLVQVGTQAMADRYTYLPQIGIAIALVWTGADLMASLRPALRRAAIATAACSVAALGFAAHAEARHWRDSVSLFTHGLAAAPRASTLHLDLGVALEKRGRLGEAVDHYREALATHPGLVAAHFNLGNALRSSGDLEAAAASYRRAALLAPADARAANNLAGTLRLLGHADEASQVYRGLLARRPDDPAAHLGVASLHEARGESTLAADHYQRALAAAPGWEPARAGLARTDP